MIKQKWQQLAQRDRKILVLGGIVVAVLLIYTYVWSPMSDAADNEYAALRRGQSLVQWLDHAVQRLSAYQALGYRMPQATKEASLKIVLQVFRNQRIAYHMTSSKQLDKTLVGVAMGQVPFDRLVTALGILADQYGIVVQSARMTRRETDGLVDAKMVLQQVAIS